MFNFIKKSDLFDLQKQVDDLKRSLLFEQRERVADAARLETKVAYESHLKSLKHIEARYKAEALASAAEARANDATAYTNKIEKMAAKCAADFGTATAKMTEQFLAVMKELKPAEAKLTVLPTTTINDCRKGGSSIKMN